MTIIFKFKYYSNCFQNKSIAEQMQHGPDILWGRLEAFNTTVPKKIN